MVRVIITSYIVVLLYSLWAFLTLGVNPLLQSSSNDFYEINYLSVWFVLISFPIVISYFLTYFLAASCTVLMPLAKFTSNSKKRIRLNSWKLLVKFNIILLTIYYVLRRLSKSWGFTIYPSSKVLSKNLKVNYKFLEYFLLSLINSTSFLILYIIFETVLAYRYFKYAQYPRGFFINPQRIVFLLGLINIIIFVVCVVFQSQLYNLISQILQFDKMNPNLTLIFTVIVNLIINVYYIRKEQFRIFDDDKSSLSAANSYIDEIGSIV